MPRQHLSPLRVPRSPYSPPLKTWSPPGWERRFALLCHPARASPASTRTTEYPPSESTLCASQQRLSEILELSVSPKTISPSTIPALASPIELTTRPSARGSCASIFDYSPLLHAYYPCHSPLLSPMLSSRPVSLHLSEIPDMAPTETFSTLRRLSCSRTSHDHEPTGHNVSVDASTTRANDGSGSNGRNEIAGGPLIFPPSQHSTRLRKLAPPPLRLSPVAHPAIQRRRSFVRDNDLLSAPLVDIPIHSGARLSPVHAASPQNRRSAVTTIDLPEDLSTSFSSFEILQWRRRVSRVFDAPLGPPIPERRASEAPVVQIANTAPIAPASPVPVSLTPLAPQTPSSVESHYTRFDDEPLADTAATDTSVSQSPPPPGRTRLISLPPIPYACSSGEGEALLSPLIPDLRTALAIPGLMLRAEKCAEAVGDAAMCLCSCSLLREPEAIFDLCKSVQRTLHAVQQELDSTPAVRSHEETAEMRVWFQKHWQLISSLERNLNIFYLFADQLRARPPRIHRLAGHLDKLHAFRDKFADVARRLAVSHQKLHLVGVRAEFFKEHRAARVQAESERKRRGDFRAIWTEGKARRHALKDEIQYSKARAQHIRHTWMVDHGFASGFGGRDSH
ncbi:hypothetical protein DAEQUDRAFT_737907 [Daedalea quercina L-15889]|uniref:Uncharacterized protein n=1 Tax=Daedalea quercina L-15889 TaxID=1314783 RepID=A0A165QMF6_9APHY|nr:hypothetical protein DAEQUDRAFT_737907 [Daedalea quercina L-15889]